MRAPIALITGLVGGVAGFVGGRASVDEYPTRIISMAFDKAGVLTVTGQMTDLRTGYLGPTDDPASPSATPVDVPRDGLRRTVVIGVADTTHIIHSVGAEHTIQVRWPTFANVDDQDLGAEYVAMRFAGSVDLQLA